MTPKQLIVFDMDGVIVDVSRSYREAARQTARLFFKGAQAWEHLPKPLFPLADLARIKQSGGLNNDWDLTYRIITLLFRAVNSPKTIHASDPWRQYHAFIEQCDVSALARFLNATDMPLSDLAAECENPDNTCVADFYINDVGSGNIIKQIFQEVYLGKGLFESTYDTAPRVHSAEGYINRETLLLDKAILSRLAEKNILAIATGRPKSEADYPLERFNINKYFRMVYTLDDCLKAEKQLSQQKGSAVSLSKPHPFMLDAIASRIAERISACYYVGDMPDDMMAAARSKAQFKGIGVVFSAPEKALLISELHKAGAEHVVEEVAGLMDILTIHPRRCSQLSDSK